MYLTQHRTQDHAPHATRPDRRRRTSSVTSTGSVMVTSGGGARREPSRLPAPPLPALAGLLGRPWRGDGVSFQGLLLPPVLLPLLPLPLPPLLPLPPPPPAPPPPAPRFGPPVDHGDESFFAASTVRHVHVG